MRVSICWCGSDLVKGPHPDYGECPKCGTLVAYERPDDKGMAEQYGYKTYWHDNMASVGQPPIEQRAEDDFSNRIPYWLKLVRAHQAAATSVFEIGCAHGGFLRFCLDHGFKHAHGCEVDEYTCVFARKHFKLPVVLSGLFPKISFQGMLPSYDIVCAFDVFEHFADPLAALKVMRSLTHDKSRLFIQAPWYRDEGEKWPQFRPGEHLYLFREDSLVAAMGVAQLRVLSFQRGLFLNDFMAVSQWA